MDNTTKAFRVAHSTFDGTTLERENLDPELIAFKEQGFTMTFCDGDLISLHHATVEGLAGHITSVRLQDVNSAREMQVVLGVFLAGVAFGKGER